MYRQILSSLVVIAAAASLVVAVPTANAKPVSSSQLNGPADPWLQNLNAQRRFENVQAIDPWQSNLFARKAYETRNVAVSTESTSTGGFGWDDAGIGAGVVLGTLLVGAASVVTIRRTRGPLAH
jgi:hypothetical protein